MFVYSLQQGKIIKHLSDRYTANTYLSIFLVLFVCIKFHLAYNHTFFRKIVQSTMAQFLFREFYIDMIDVLMTISNATILLRITGNVLGTQIYI